MGISDEVPGWHEGCKVTAPEGPAAIGAVEQTRSETGLTPESWSDMGEVRDTDRPRGKRMAWDGTAGRRRLQ